MPGRVNRIRTCDRVEFGCELGKLIFLGVKTLFLELYKYGFSGCTRGVPVAPKQHQNRVYTVLFMVHAYLHRIGLFNAYPAYALLRRRGTQSTRSQPLRPLISR